ncbi:MAG: exodeoxyribonuclease VII small subunit [Firmicutes bacterium]|nr:exodeoxyribonuclease VII small subunit [Bacillota bacterium]
MTAKKKDFEESFEKLRACAAGLNDPDVKLDRAIELYKEGAEQYNVCRAILEEAEQLIQLYDKETDELMEMNQPGRSPA